MGKKRKASELADTVAQSALKTVPQTVSSASDIHSITISNGVGTIEDDVDQVVHVEPTSEEENGDEIIMINSSDSESDSPKLTEPAKGTKRTGNALEDNQDFISLDFSSDEEPSSEPEEEEALPSAAAVNEDVESADKAVVINEQYPWLRNNDHTKQLEVSDWLTMEIKDFVRYVSPAEEEIKARNRVTKRLSQAIEDLWPDAELHCFGSYATDLYLPGSDIDTVIISEQGHYDTKSSLYQLSSYLRKNHLGKSIETIAHARVPIIKFVDPETNIHIDISFERSNGIHAASTIIDWLKITPGLRELVMIVKQFLAVRHLNEVHTGGLGGFSIVCLVYSFLQLHPRIITEAIDPMENLGVLLIEFFELYGFNFGYDNVAIAFKENRPIWVSRRTRPYLQSTSNFSLAIEDPQDYTNNISRGTFNLRDLKRSFSGAFEMLTNKCYGMAQATYKQRLGQSILGDIIRYRGKVRDFVDARDRVGNFAYQIASGQASRDDLLSDTEKKAPSSSKKKERKERRKQERKERKEKERREKHNLAQVVVATEPVPSEPFEYFSDSSEGDMTRLYEESQGPSKKHQTKSAAELLEVDDNEEYEPAAQSVATVESGQEDFNDSD